MTRSFSSIVFLLTSAACGPGPSDDSTGTSSAVEVGTERQALASWSSAAPMSTARFNHRATVLPSGKVLAVGGTNSSGLGLASAELYTP